MLSLSCIPVWLLYFCVLPIYSLRNYLGTFSLWNFMIPCLDMGLVSFILLCITNRQADIPFDLGAFKNISSMILIFFSWSFWDVYWHVGCYMGSVVAFYFFLIFCTFKLLPVWVTLILEAFIIKLSGAPWLSFYIQECRISCLHWKWLTGSGETGLYFRSPQIAACCHCPHPPYRILYRFSREDPFFPRNF